MFGLWTDGLTCAKQYAPTSSREGIKILTNKHLVCRMKRYWLTKIAVTKFIVPGENLDTTSIGQQKYVTFSDYYRNSVMVLQKKTSL